MRIAAAAVVVIVAVAGTATAAPATCPAGKKKFECHALAVSAHLGIDGKVDLASARSLYADACAKGDASSCNNLGVLARRYPEVARDTDPNALFQSACKRLDQTACENARRLASHPELAVQLSLRAFEIGGSAGRWEQVKRAACTAGDIFRCDDPSSRASVGKLLADECASGVTTTCSDAAARSTDDATIATLLGLGCKARDGRACHALATRRAAAGAEDVALLDLWKGACSDQGFDVTEEDAAARSEACKRWGKAARARADQLRAATLAATYCTASKAGACLVAEELYDRAGDHARAFAIIKPQCDEDSPKTAACRALGERYVLGNGTRADVAKGLALLGGSCPEDLAWTSCKQIGTYLQRKSPLEAAELYQPYCKAGNDEACYLRARAVEADPEGPSCLKKPTVPELKAMYDGLCTKRYRDACQRSAGMCRRAMADFFKPEQCGYGIGDGVERFGLSYHAVVELCPKAAWTPAIKKAMNKIDADCRAFEQSGGRCER